MRIEDWLSWQILKILDEIMSAFKPQITKRGDLPHLTFIKRKPEPLGTEMKAAADTATRITLYLEIQKGKEVMENEEFTDICSKVTSACTKRLVKYSSRKFQEIENEGLEYTETWLGNAWFASVQTAIQVSEFGHFIGPVKCSHSLYPKKWIRDTMEKWPGGSYIVLESNIEGVDLLAVGYK